MFLIASCNHQSTPDGYNQTTIIPSTITHLLCTIESSLLDYLNDMFSISIIIGGKNWENIFFNFLLIFALQYIEERYEI